MTDTDPKIKVALSDADWTTTDDEDEVIHNVFEGPPRGGS